jgi:uncharacterized membrane protein
MEQSQNRARIWELDFFRGIALILMIYFHVIYDMKELYNYPIVYDSGINYYIGKVSAILFMIIAGISCSLSQNNFKRSLKILAAAMVITIATHLFDPGIGIKFGILHFLGVSILLYPLFKKLNVYLLPVAGTIIVILGNIITRISVSYDWLFPLGLSSNSFVSSDYYPLLPWFGVFLYGVFLGRIFYSSKESVFSFSLGSNPVSMVGKSTLTVYIIHQPLILLVLKLVSMLR